MVVGFWGLGFSLSCLVLGLDLGLKGTCIRLRADNSLGRVGGVGSLGLTVYVLL